MNKSLRRGILKVGASGRNQLPLLENGLRYKSNKRKNCNMESKTAVLCRTRRKQAQPQRKNEDEDGEDDSKDDRNRLVADSNHNVQISGLSEITITEISISKQNGIFRNRHIIVKQEPEEEIEEDDSQQAMMEAIEAMESNKVINGIKIEDDSSLSPPPHVLKNHYLNKRIKLHHFENSDNDFDGFSENQNFNDLETSSVIEPSIIIKTFPNKSVISSFAQTGSDIEDEDTVPLVNSLNNGNSVLKDNRISPIIDGSMSASALSSLAAAGGSEHHQDDNIIIPSLKCPQCLKGFQNLDALKNHIHTNHSGERGGSSFGFSCLQCNAGFPSRDQLEKHELLHSPNAHVSCKICSKSFANVYRLQRHMISHDESALLRKFKCMQCDKAFKFKHHLKEHLRIHSGEKPFECCNCGKRFSHSGSYSSHMTSKKCLIMNLKVRNRNAAESKHIGSVNIATVTPSSVNRLSSHVVNNNNNNNNNNNINNNNNNNKNNNNSGNMHRNNPINEPILSKYDADTPNMVMPNYGAVPASYLPTNIPNPFYLHSAGFPLHHRSLSYTFAPNINHFLEQLSTSPPFPNHAIGSPEESESRGSEVGLTTTRVEDCTPANFTGLAAKLEEAVIRHEMMNGVSVGGAGGGSYCSESDDEQHESGKELLMTEDEDSESMTDGKKVRVRSQIAEDQLIILRQHYALNPRPKRDELDKISRKVGFPIRVVQVWFQNNRARDRREGRLVHVPYVPSYSPFAEATRSSIDADTYSANSSPIPPCARDQPLDLSTKKSSNSSPTGSPTYRYDSDEYAIGGGVVNLSKKSPNYERSASSTRHSFSDSSSEIINNSPPTTPSRDSSNKMHQNLSHHVFNGSSLLNDGVFTSSVSERSLCVNSPSITASPIRAGSCSPNSSDSRSWKRGYSSESDKIKEDSIMSDDLSLSVVLTNGKRLKVNSINIGGGGGGDTESEGQFMCQYCEKSFIKQSSLTRHIYEHSGQRPFKCLECPKAFKHKHHLAEHKRLHSGEKPFQCSKCFKRFSHSGSFSQHMNHRSSYCKPYRN